MLDIQNVSKYFHDIKVLDGISLSIELGHVIGLAGPSGGGKSTLLRCIQGLEMIDGGKIICKHKTGFMFQDFQLFSHMTVLQNLIYAPSLSNHKHNQITKRATKLLCDLSISDKKDYFPNQLSGGQKQRVALARSLMMSPELLLCDEPTSGLDVATIEDVISLLSLIRDMGVTMVIASHDLDFLTKIAGRIILLKSGKIAVDIDPGTIQHPISYLKEYY